MRSIFEKFRSLCRAGFTALQLIGGLAYALAAALARVIW
jgi:hypothetical protein